MFLDCLKKKSILEDEFYKHFDKQLLPKVFHGKSRESLICPGGHSDLQKLKFFYMELGGIVGKALELIPIPQINSSIAFILVLC